MTSKASRTIRTPDGREIVISSDDLTNGDLVIAEILLEMAVEQGSTEIRVSMDELARRVRAEGYDPNTGEPLQLTIGFGATLYRYSERAVSV